MSLSVILSCRLSRCLARFLAPDQTPGFLLGNVPCLGNHGVRGHRSVPPSAPTPLPRCGRGVLLTPSPAPALRERGVPHPRPLSRAAGEGCFSPPAPLPRGGRPSPPAPLPRCGRPSPPAPLPRGGRPSPPAPLPRGGRPSPPAPLPHGGPPSPPAPLPRCGRGVLLTPSPSPALRERGELVGGLDIVDRHRRSVATATLTLPLPLAVEERKRARGKCGGCIPPSARRGGAEEGQREGRGQHPPLPLAVEERKKARGKVGGSIPPSSPAVRERKGVGGKVRATKGRSETNVRNVGNGQWSLVRPCVVRRLSP